MDYDEYHQRRAARDLSIFQRTFTGFQPPRDLEKRFQSVRDDLFAFFNPLVGDGYHDDLLGRFLQLVNSVESGLYASLYHFRNLSYLEGELRRVATSIFREVPVPQNRTGSIAGGDTRRLDFEYQAVHIALRRTMEYLAQLVAFTFDKKIGSFRQLETTIQKVKPTKITQDVIETHREIMKDCLNLIGPKTKGQTIRDQIAHYDAVKFGCLNIAWYRGELSVFVAGGGHNGMPDAEESISDLIQEDLYKVESAIFKMIRCLDFRTCALSSREKS